MLAWHVPLPGLAAIASGFIRVRDRAFLHAQTGRYPHGALKVQGELASWRSTSARVPYDVWPTTDIVGGDLRCSNIRLGLFLILACTGSSRVIAPHYSVR
jgi:hypothetical protein